jgi:hypothetical protein
MCSLVLSRPGVLPVLHIAVLQQHCAGAMWKFGELYEDIPSSNISYLIESSIVWVPACGCGAVLWLPRAGQYCVGKVSGRSRE